MLTFSTYHKKILLFFFYISPLVQFSKFKNFLWVCWFLVKNLSNSIPPAWKLDNPYCHIHDLFRLLLEVYLATFIAIPLDKMYVGNSHCSLQTSSVPGSRLSMYVCSKNILQPPGCPRKVSKGQKLILDIN